MLALPSAITAHHTFLRLQSLGLTHLRLLSAVSTGSLLVAYMLSPRYGRHPYLLWTALTVALSAGTDLWLSRDARRLLVKERRRAAAAATGSSNGGGSSAGNEQTPAAAAATGDSSPANGEEVKIGMERFQVAQAVRAGIAGLGFLMSVVGIWGDGY